MLLQAGPLGGGQGVALSGLPMADMLLQRQQQQQQELPAPARIWFQQIACLHMQQGYHAAVQPEHQEPGPTHAQQHNLHQHRQHQHTGQGVQCSGSAVGSAQALYASTAPTGLGSSSRDSSSTKAAASSVHTEAVSEGEAALDLGLPEEQQQHAFDRLILSSPKEAHQQTLQSLHRGQSKNLDQLAYMFDPRAVLAGELVWSPEVINSKATLSFFAAVTGWRARRQVGMAAGQV